MLGERFREPQVESHTELVDGFEAILKVFSVKVAGNMNSLSVGVAVDSCGSELKYSAGHPGDTMLSCVNGGLGHQPTQHQQPAVWVSDGAGGLSCFWAFWLDDQNCWLDVQN